MRVETSDGCVAEGVAECSPRDNYCRRLGREIALGRALKELEHRRNDKRLAEASIARAMKGWTSNIALAALRESAEEATRNELAAQAVRDNAVRDIVEEARRTAADALRRGE